MQRREFSKVTTAAAAIALTGCGGGGDTTGLIGPAPASGPAPAPAPAPATALTPTPESPAAAAPAGAGRLAIGTNLCGMEWAAGTLRFGPATLPNLQITVPRRADVSYLAANGYTRNRLPILWEMLQPMLNDTPANLAARAVIGNPGAFHGGYESYITDVLDAHAAAGTKCVIQCHNFCRYRDFKFQPDGSVTGLVQPSDPLIHPYTTDDTQVTSRIFALAPGATLKQSHFTDFWSRVAVRWKDHPGFGGYGLMNEPYFMPKPGETVEASGGLGEDLTIWPAYAQAAINAIRALDPSNPIYVSGNQWSSAMALPSQNPGFPLSGGNLIYEVHVYLDAASNGANFDYDTEVAKNFSAGLGGVPIGPDTGRNRIQMAIDWAQAKGVQLALTETGMPVDDPRWQVMFQRLVDTAGKACTEICSWNGGSHWKMRNGGINHIPGWHQNKTLEPSMSGPMKLAAGIAKACLFDDGPGWATAGIPITITVYARGNLASPATVQVTSSNGGTLSKSTLTIGAGANGQDTFAFTPAPNAVTTLTYTTASADLPPPPPRKVYSLSDPVAYAATSLQDAAMAIIAKYSACKWDMADGYTDYLQGVPAADGQALRAIADSGYGSSPGNAMEMLNWINKDTGTMGTMSVPVMHVANGRKSSDHSVPGTYGFWCRKSIPVAGVQPNPRNRVPYNMEDPHFAIAAVSIPGLDQAGVLFEASNAEKEYCSELSFSNGRPQASWTDAAGNVVTLSSWFPLPVNVPAVVSFTSAAGAQRLRVNSDEVASASATFIPGAYDQLLLGWGFLNYWPRDGFMGQLYSVITGKGAPTAQELTVLERYLGSTAGI
jgi:endoglucanase